MGTRHSALTFRCLKSNQLGVFTLAGTVEGLHAGIVHGIEVETVNGANCFLAAVDFLQMSIVEYTLKLHLHSIRFKNDSSTHPKLAAAAVVQLQDIALDKAMIRWLPRNCNRIVLRRTIRW